MAASADGRHGKAHAESIRARHLSRVRPGRDLPVALAHLVAREVKVCCGVSPLKAHRWARGWTVAEAIGQFRLMCERERLGDHGLSDRSWLGWEAGATASGRYQDLLCRLFQTSGVALGFTPDYTPTSPAVGRALVVDASGVGGSESLLRGADTGGGWAVPVGEAVRVEAVPGRFFGGDMVDVRVLAARDDDGRVVATVPEGDLTASSFARGGRGLVFAVVPGRERPYGLDVRVARRRLKRSPAGAPLVVPSVFELDELTVSVLWAVLSMDAALLGDDALLAGHRRALSGFEAQPRSAVRHDAAADISPVSQMWLGSRFCARHILRHIEALATDPPVFWTQEQRGEEASAWLLFAHKHAYLRNLARRFAGSAVARVFCVPRDAVEASPMGERILFFLAAALMESFGIEVVVTIAPEYAGMDGFVLDRDRQAIVATWVGADGLWQVDVTGARATVRDFADASRYARARSVIAQRDPDARLRALADYLGLDWPWLVARCAAFGSYGCAGLAEPRSRLLSAAGVDRACRFVGEFPVAA